MSLIMRHRFKGFSEAGAEGTFSGNLLSLSRPAGPINIDMSSLTTRLTSVEQKNNLQDAAIANNDIEAVSINTDDENNLNIILTKGNGTEVTGSTSLDLIAGSLPISEIPEVTINTYASVYVRKTYYDRPYEVQSVGIFAIGDKGYLMRNVYVPTGSEQQYTSDSNNQASTSVNTTTFTQILTEMFTNLILPDGTYMVELISLPGTSSSSLVSGNINVSNGIITTTSMIHTISYYDSTPGYRDFRYRLLSLNLT